MEEEEPRVIKTIPHSNQKYYKNRTDPKFETDKELYRSNSANDLLEIKEKNSKTKSERSKKKKRPHLYRTMSAKSFFDHYDLKNCEYCQGIDNLLKKDKSNLSSFIQKNPSFLKLFGNPRYNKSSPFLFVEDHKNRIDDERIGLLPIPSKPAIIMKSKDENNNLYEIQRKIVMMRRFQYGKKYNEEMLLNNQENEDFFQKIITIQLWWKQMYKIIYIQKIFRGFRIRKRVDFIISFINIINRWQRLLDKIKARRALRDLFKKVGINTLPNEKDIKGYDYMSKIRKKEKPLLNIQNLDNLKKNNNNYAKFLNNGKNNKDNEQQNKNNNFKKDTKNEDEKSNDSNKNKFINNNVLKNLDDLNKLTSGNIPKDKIKNNSSLLTKKYFDKKDIINKIDKIGNHVRDYLKYKHNIQKKNINDDNNNNLENGLYIDKIYIPKNAQRDFNLSKNGDENNKKKDDRKSKDQDQDKLKDTDSNMNNNKNGDENNKKIKDMKNKDKEKGKNKLKDSDLNKNNKNDGNNKKINERKSKDKEQGKDDPKYTDTNKNNNKNEDENNKAINDKRSKDKDQGKDKLKNIDSNNKGDENNSHKNKILDDNIYNQDNHENKNIINSKDFIFKNKNSYIEKIRRKKNKFKDNISNKHEEGNKNDFPEDNNKSDNKDDKDKDKYNSNKSINNQNDLFNMMLNVSKSQEFEILNSPRFQKKSKLQFSNIFNFSFNKNITPNNNEDKDSDINNSNNIDNEEDKNSNINKENLPIDPIKKNIYGNNICYISKELIINDNSKNKKKQKNKNIFEIESNNQNINYLGNDTNKIKNDNNNTKNKNYSLIIIKESFNYKGKDEPKDNANDKLLNNKPNKKNNLAKEYPEDNEKNKENLNKKFINLIFEPNSKINYIYNIKDNDKEINKDNNIFNSSNIFKNLVSEKNPNINYIGNDNINKEGKNNKSKNKNNIIIDSNNNFNYLNNKQNDVKNKDDKIKTFDKNNLTMDYNNNFNYIANNQNNKGKDKNDKLIEEKNTSFNYKVNNIINNSNEINKRNNIIIQSNLCLNYLGQNKQNTKNKNNNFIIENNSKVYYKGNLKDKKDDINKNDIKPKINLIIENNPNINYIGNKKKSNLNIETNSNINYPASYITDKEYLKNKNIVDNLDKNKIIIDIQKGLHYPGIEKDNKNILDKNNNLMSESNININYIKENDHQKKLNKDIDNKRQANKNKKEEFIIQANSNFNYPGTKSDNKDEIKNKNNKFFNQDDLQIESNPKINYDKIDKTDNDNEKNKYDRIKNKIDDCANINNKIINNRNDIIYKKPQNGLIISKLQLKNNLDEIKKIQDALRKYLFKNMNKENEKIYKKPLFNQFYYYIDEFPNEKKAKNKKKRKPKNDNNNLEKDKNKNLKDKDEHSKKKENGQNDDNNEENNIKKNISNNNTNDNEDTQAKYVKRIIPKKNTSEIFRIKHNHLLKIVKVQKGRSILEKLIQSGKVVPNKPRTPEEEKLLNEYKSKTPDKNLENKKYNEDDGDDMKNGKKKDSKSKIDEIKNYLSKSLGEEDIDIDDEGNNQRDEGNMTDYDDDSMRNKRIKKIKNNMGNYFYMSKIRKGNIDDSQIKKIQNKFRTYSKKDLDNIIDNKNNKNENIENKIDVKPNVIKNICYYDKVIINNDIYNKYLNNDDKVKKNNNESIIYKIPIKWKKNKDENNNINQIFNNNIDYITKLRQIKIKDKTNKNIEYEENNDKNKNRNNIANKRCFITKERKKNHLSLPNINYKKKNYLITKEIKMNNTNNNNSNLLSRKNYNFKNTNNNNCLITKERKAKLKPGIILPIKKLHLITKGRKKLLDNKDIILLPQKEISFITKIRQKENMNQIKTIQNLFKIKSNKIKNDNIKKQALYNNEERTAFIPRRKCYYKEVDDSDFDDENFEKDNYYLNGYISKIYKRIIYKYPNEDRCYISKQNLINKNNISENKKNYSFLKLLNFFIKKNTQEYAYPKLFENIEVNKNKRLNTNYNYDTNRKPIDEKSLDKDNKFTYPKYYKKLKRLFDFYKAKKRGESPRGKKIYDEILPDIENTKSLNDLITKLNDDPEKNNKLINNMDKKNKNETKINENDYINEIGEFAKYDKNLSNGAFIKNKLKENKNLKKNANIFNIIKIVDEEYNNLINGKYCNKCGKELTKCQCDDINDLFKDTEESNNNEENKEEEDDDNLDFNIGDDDNRNKKVNYFEYDSNKSKGLLVTNKPKLSDYISQPKSNLIIYNKKQLNEINQKIKDKDKNINKYINISNNSNNNYKNSNTFQSISSNSGNRYNNRYNNNLTNSNNSSNFNNDSNLLNSRSIRNNNANNKGNYNKKYSFKKPDNN